VEQKAYRLTLISFLLTCLLGVIAIYNVWRGFEADTNARRVNSIVEGLRSDSTLAIKQNNELRATVTRIESRQLGIDTTVSGLEGSISRSTEASNRAEEAARRLESRFSTFAESVSGLKPDVTKLAETNRRLRESLGLGESEPIK